MWVDRITKGCVRGAGDGGRDVVLLKEVPHLSIILVQIGDKEGGRRNGGGKGTSPCSIRSSIHIWTENEAK